MIKIVPKPHLEISRKYYRLGQSCYVFSTPHYWCLPRTLLVFTISTISAGHQHYDMKWPKMDVIPIKLYRKILIFNTFE